MKLLIKIKPKKIFKYLTIVSVALAILSVAAMYLVMFYGPHEYVERYLLLFNMGEEISIPTWYSQTILLAAGIIAIVIAYARKNNGRKDSFFWLILGIIFAGLSIDEGSQIHELSTRPVREYLVTEGTWLHFGWIIFGLIAVVLFGLFFFRFWLRLPSTTKILFLIAATFYVGGFLGVEMIGGWYVSNYGENYTYSLISSLEEWMEIFGVTVFIYALTDYMKNHKISLRVE